jgi:hypothetical protein
MPGEQQRNEISNNPQPEPDPNQPMVYQIRVKSHLAEDWTDWFEGLTITLENTGYTLLTGPVVDQAALHGLLKKIRDLGMSLISVNYLERDSTTFRSDQGNPVDDRP